MCVPHNPLTGCFANPSVPASASSQPESPLSMIPSSPSSSTSSNSSVSMSFSTTVSSAAGMATVHYHDGGKSAPILNDGIITPSVLQLWRKKAEIFFEVKKIKAVDQVKSILGSFSAHRWLTGSMKMTKHYVHSLGLTSSLS